VREENFGHKIVAEKLLTKGQCEKLTTEAQLGEFCLMNFATISIMVDAVESCSNCGFNIWNVSAVSIEINQLTELPLNA